uniref:Uncharacterized protein n=1 Tax=Oryza barthii TaxID=65489 RepID=A0A0D3HDE4_9ORYZ
MGQTCHFTLSTSLYPISFPNPPSLLPPLSSIAHWWWRRRGAEDGNSRGQSRLGAAEGSQGRRRAGANAARTTRSASASTAGHRLCLHYWSLELVASIVTTRARSAAGGGLPSSLHLCLHRRPPELIPSPLSACRVRSASTSIVGHSSY